MGGAGGSLNGHSASRSILRRSFAAQLIPESSNSSWPVRLSPRYCQSKDTSFLFFFSHFFFSFSSFGEQRKKLLKQPVKSRHGPARSHHFSENAWQMGNMCALMAPNLFIISLF